jgi:hypothetical protein
VGEAEHFPIFRWRKMGEAQAFRRIVHISTDWLGEPNVSKKAEIVDAKIRYSMAQRDGWFAREIKRVYGSY